MAGWFYAANYVFYGNALYMPGISSKYEHSFISFNLIDLFSAKTYEWHMSPSVWTGYYASFLSLDALHMPAQEIILRNLVYFFSLFFLAVIVIGIISCIKNITLLGINIFLFISMACIIKLHLKYQLVHGLLKSSYAMYMATLASVYLACGYEWLNNNVFGNKRFSLCFWIILVLTDISVMLYLFKFNFYVINPQACVWDFHGGV